MMLAWKMAACLAAGNTVVLKPAQVCIFSVVVMIDGFGYAYLNSVKITRSYK